MAKLEPASVAFDFSDALPLDALKQLYAFVVAPATTNKRDSLRAALVTVDYAAQFVVGEPTALAAPPDRAASLKAMIEEATQARTKTAATWTPPAWLLPLALTIISDLLKLLGG